ncbi:NAD-dependent epimerase/dehydratase family protein [Kitasatospora sp. NA04385]|uniref:NAD-dependent epimerase/dehydratase family protein n=1 Tax=Kitasatospora sp. NA04385 TaxID=2742135 RepID=UPI001591B35E|nr:NAD-dependent epimerase/dehydratase family protein [Kitasatospora sp. NA04385]QKW22930.1 NAD-dependent epimerase/dehydratase family protein [Kitasatospora sp. NA04385]
MDRSGRDAGGSGGSDGSVPDDDRRVRRAVVTGGAGFVGSHLCDRLREEGASVVCVDNLLTGSVDNLAARDGDPGFVLDRSDVSEEFDVEGPVDLVLHLASPASPHDYARHPIATLRAGAHGTLNALELARRKGARFLLASTSEVYGDPLVHPQVESYWGNVNPVGPRSQYDEAKRFAEALTTAYRSALGVDTVIVRLFNTYGPRMRPTDGRAVPTFITQALAGQPLTVTGDGAQTRSICYVDDTVSGILAAAAGGHPGPVNIGNPVELSVLELAERIRELCSSTSPVEFVERPGDDPTLRRPDIGLARSAFGWQPVVDFEKGLAMTIDWFARLTPAGR